MWKRITGRRIHRREMFDMKIVADENIPYAKELFSNIGEVTLLPGRAMTSDDAADADILLVRSVTGVNAALLEHSKVKFVGTCTIGTDHLDTNYLDRNEIVYSSAPGCNAYGVVQYDLGALAKTGKLNSDNRVAIVGCGNVGGRIYRALKGLGIQCYCVDPFKSKAELPDLAEFDAVYDADVICVHTPLTRSGPFPTYELFNDGVLSKLKPDALLLNAGRGDVIDNKALLNHLEKNAHFSAVLDVWQNEPHINIELLDALTYATPHIAGYSFEGRVNGSFMIFEALCGFLSMSSEESNLLVNRVKVEAFGSSEPLAAQDVLSAIMATYDITDDDTRLRASVAELPGKFDVLRKNYPKRREFSHYTVSDVLAEHIGQFNAVGFNVI